MEFHLLPAHRANRPTPKVPYVANERWDGSSWLAYPKAKGRSYDGESFDLMEYYRTERLHPTPLREQESFFQTWLYFGLIFESVGINAAGSPTPDSKPIIDRVYKLIVFEDEGQKFVNLDEHNLNTLRDIGLSQLSADLEARKAYCDRMIECLSCCQTILAGLPRDFNYLIKYSIASLGEIFTQTVNFALERLQIPRTFGRMWSVGFLNQDAKEAMRLYGWCPSDIARAEAKYHSIQALYLIQMLDKSSTLR